MPFVQSYLLTNQCDELKNVFLQGLWKTHVSFIFILIELYHIFPKISRRKSIQWKPWRAVHLEMYVGHTVGTISSMYTTSENKFRELSYLFSIVLPLLFLLCKKIFWDKQHMVVLFTYSCLTNGRRKWQNALELNSSVRPSKNWGLVRELTEELIELFLIETGPCATFPLCFLLLMSSSLNKLTWRSGQNKGQISLYCKQASNVIVAQYHSHGTWKTPRRECCDFLKKS